MAAPPNVNVGGKVSGNREKAGKTCPKLSLPSSLFQFTSGNPYKIGQVLHGTLAHHHVQIATTEQQQRILAGKYSPVISPQEMF